VLTNAIEWGTRRLLGDLLERFRQWIARERAAREAGERLARAGV
jgi:hypothetical protein